MLKIRNAFLIVVSIAFMSTLESCVKLKMETVEVDAPFDMPAIEIPDFSDCDVFSIVDFGAEQGDKEKTSAAIDAAIDKANAKGGGTVLVPEGEWLTKTLHFKSNVNLHLAKGAVLLFSEDPQDYLPAVHTTWEGMECYNYSPLVYAYECENVAITGEGKLKAKLDIWKKWYARPAAHMNSLKWLYEKASTYSPVEERVMTNDSSHLRPQFIQFNRCQNVLMDGISIVNSPFWTIHPYMCKNVVLRNLNVYAHGHNNDGVDPEMTQNMLVEDCTFDQGDDAIAVKSGRNQDAWRLDTPTKNLVVRNCTIKNGHQLLAIGSELSGGVENVLMENCKVADRASMFHLVFIKTNERRGGFVKNIIVKNIESNYMREGILGIETDVLYQWRNLVPTYEVKLTPISDVYLENIHAKDAKFISRLQGQEALPIKNVNLSNVVADSIRGTELYIQQNVDGFQVQ